MPMEESTLLPTERIKRGWYRKIWNSLKLEIWNTVIGRKLQFISYDIEEI